MKGSFQVLLAWVLGEFYLEPMATEELSEAQIEAFQSAAVRRPRSFAVVVKRNWKLEAATRDLRLPPELRELWTLPDGAAVDRLIGYEDGDRWCPGISGLEPTESKALRWRLLEYESTENICRWMKVTPRTVSNYTWEGLRKLRRLFRPEFATIAREGNR